MRSDRSPLAPPRSESPGAAAVSAGTTQTLTVPTLAGLVTWGEGAPAGDDSTEPATPIRAVGAPGPVRPALVITF